MSTRQQIKRKNMVFGIEEIKEHLPHRFPYLMVDRIIEAGSESCVGLKNVTINECFFLGHFPKQAIMPGTLIIESMAQVAAFVGLSKKEIQEEIKINQPRQNGGGYLITVNIKFHQPVIPGDHLLIKVKIIKRLGKVTMFNGEAVVDGEVMAKGEFSVVKVDD